MEEWDSARGAASVKDGRKEGGAVPAEETDREGSWRSRKEREEGSREKETLDVSRSHLPHLA